MAAWRARLLGLRNPRVWGKNLSIHYQETTWSMPCPLPTGKHSSQRTCHTVLKSRKPVKIFDILKQWQLWKLVCEGNKPYLLLRGRIYYPFYSVITGVLRGGTKMFFVILWSPSKENHSCWFFRSPSTSADQWQSHFPILIKESKEIALCLSALLHRSIQLKMGLQALLFYLPFHSVSFGNSELLKLV